MVFVYFKYKNYFTIPLEVDRLTTIFDLCIAFDKIVKKVESENIDDNESHSINVFCNNTQLGINNDDYDRNINDFEDRSLTVKYSISNLYTEYPNDNNPRIDRWVYSNYDYIKSEITRYVNNVNVLDDIQSIDTTSLNIFLRFSRNINLNETLNDITNRINENITTTTNVLSENAFSKLNKIKLKDLDKNSIDDICSICRCEFEDGEEDDDEFLLKIDCNHVFHYDCLKTWLTERKNTCPICRYVVGDTDDLETRTEEYIQETNIDDLDP